MEKYEQIKAMVNWKLQLAAPTTTETFQYISVIIMQNPMPRQITRLPGWIGHRNCVTDPEITGPD